MIRVVLPGSTSNIGPGFDTLGLAVNRFLTLTARPQQELEVTIQGFGSSSLPRDGTNLVIRTMHDIFQRCGKVHGGCSLEIENGIPDCGGLGVSGAMIAGGVVLANELGSLNLPMERILTLATQIEGHPDNVTASLLGGLTVSSFDGGALRTRTIPVAVGLSLIVALPELRVVTSEARSTLPEAIPYRDAVQNIQNVATLVAAFSAGDFTALRWATADRLHEHIRSQMIRGYNDVKHEALEAGAIAVSISGSGPSLIAFAIEKADEIGRAMTRGFSRNGVNAAFEVMKIENTGVRIEK